MRATSSTTRCACVFLLLLWTGTSLSQESSVAPPLTLAPGSILTVRINEGLSSDQNQPGDMFSGTLTQPVVVRGIVVAQRGQTVAGRVLEARKAGMVSGTSRLRIALESLALVDGQTVPLQSQLVVRNGATSTERDAFAIAGTTGLGAAIGAAAGWGKGAAIGAGVGAAAGTIGVLLTRGHPTIIYPETTLAFQIVAPVPIYTENALQAFHAVNPAEYQEAVPPVQAASPPQEIVAVPAPAPTVVYRYMYPYPSYVYSGPVYYPSYISPYYYGPSVGFYFSRPHYYGPRIHYAPFFHTRPIPHRGAVIIRGGGRHH